MEGGLWPDWPFRALERWLWPRLCGTITHARGACPHGAIRATERRRNAALDREVNARPRRWFRWDLSSFFPAANGPSRASELTARTLPGPLYGPSRDLARAATHQRDGDFKNLQDILLVNSFRCLLLNGSTRSRWDSCGTTPAARTRVNLSKSTSVSELPRAGRAAENGGPAPAGWRFQKSSRHSPCKQLQLFTAQREHPP